MLRDDVVRVWDSWQRTLHLVATDANNRTNLGIANLGPSEVEVTLRAWSPTGSTIFGSGTVTVAPFGFHQVNRIETLIPEIADHEQIVLRVSALATSEGGSFLDRNVLVYASRVDGITGDAVFLLGR